MAQPGAGPRIDVQYYEGGSGRVWIKPERAVTVDIILQGGSGGEQTAAYLGRLVNPNGIRCSNGEPGEIRVSSWPAAQVEDRVDVTVGGDGYAMIITRLAAP